MSVFFSFLKFKYISIISIALSKSCLVTGILGESSSGNAMPKQRFNTSFPLLSDSSSSGVLGCSIGTGAVGTESLELSITETGVGGTGAVGVEALEASITETGLGGTGGVGTENVVVSLTETGVGGTGGVGTESVTVNQEWGSGAWNDGAWGE